MKLNQNIKDRLLSDNAATCRIAIKMNCTQQNIIKLIKTDSSKLCELNYAALIKETLKLNPKAKIYTETKKNRSKLDLNKLQEKLDEALSKETKESLEAWMNALEYDTDNKTKEFLNEYHKRKGGIDDNKG